jgi:hypothetical protein
VLLAAAACDSPTEPRPGLYTVVFVGAPADADGFSPLALDGGRVYGIATGGGESWPVVWSAGSFARLPAAAPGCLALPREARGGAVVGVVTCPEPGDASGRPVDAYGWGVGPGVPAGRVAAEPHSFRAISPAGVVGTLYPRAEFPGAPHRAFRTAGAGIELLLPPGAEQSEAAGIADDGTLAVTAFSECTPEGCAASRVAVLSGGAWTVLPLEGARRAVAVAVSSAGHVLGYASGGVESAFVRQGTRTRVLPLVPGTRVVLAGVNARGWAVGTGTRAAVPGRSEAEGMLWARSRQYFLSERVAGREWEVTSATAIDDADRIAGTGVHRETGQQGAILLLPAGG